MLEFYHNKGIDMLKFRCTLPNLANNCLYSSTTSKFFELTESDNDLLSRIWHNVVGRSPIVFTRKAVFDETPISKSTSIC